IPERVTTVLSIYRLAREGYGGLQIAKRLNRDKVPPIGGRSHRWYRSYVMLILGNRAVLGEWQPCRMEGRREVPDGDPIPNYFPPILTEKEWYATRHAVELRKTQRGPVGKHVRNLFTGLMHNARDGERLTTKSPARVGKKSYLVASGAEEGAADSNGIMYPSDEFEFYFLMLLTS